MKSNDGGSWQSNIDQGKILPIYTRGQVKIYLKQILPASLESEEFTFRGNPQTMTKLIFSLMKGNLLIARVQGRVNRIQVTIQQMMALI